MLKIIPPKPKAYMTVTAATWKRERMVIVDPSGGTPSVSTHVEKIIPCSYIEYNRISFYARCNFCLYYNL